MPLSWANPWFESRALREKESGCNLFPRLRHGFGDTVHPRVASRGSFCGVKERQVVGAGTKGTDFHPEADSRVRVALVDDHRIVREGLRARLPADEFEVVAEASTGASAIVAVQRFQPDIVLLDLGLPDRPGSSVCAEIRKVAPDTKVIIISMHRDEQSVRAAVDAGANAYLLKDAEDLDVVGTMRRVLAGESVIDPRAAAALFRNLGAPPAPAIPRLTEQERKILKLAAGGLTNPEIGARLYLSRHTVKEYLSHAMRKLGVKTRVEAVMEAARLGLIGDGESSPGAPDHSNQRLVS